MDGSAPIQGGSGPSEADFFSRPGDGTAAQSSGLSPETGSEPASRDGQASTSAPIQSGIGVGPSLPETTNPPAYSGFDQIAWDDDTRTPGGAADLPPQLGPATPGWGQHQIPDQLGEGGGPDSWQYNPYNPQARRGWRSTLPAQAHRYGGFRDELPLAGWWRRAIASLIDLLIVEVVAAIVMAALWPDAFASFTQQMSDYLYSSSDTLLSSSEGSMVWYFSVVIIPAVSFAYSTLMMWWRSATLGHMALGIRVMSSKDDAPGPLTLQQIMIRGLGYWGIYAISQGTLFFVVYLNAILIALHPDRKGIHDMVAKTTVVKIR